MIGFYDKNGTLLPITYNGLTLNATDTTAETKTLIYLVRYQTSLQVPIEKRNDGRDGLEAPTPSKAGRIIRLDGVTSGENIAAFYDRIKAMAAALDPVLLARNNPSVFGFLPMNFTTPTVTVPGSVASRYYCRPMQQFEPELRMRQGSVQAAFSIFMLLRDERRYLQAQSTLSGAGTANNTGDYPTWPTLTFSMTGAGASNFTATNSTTGKTLTLNLSSLVNTDAVSVTMENRTVRVNGVETGLQSTGSSWWDLSAGNNTIAYANTTNVTSLTLSWYAAFSL